MKKDICVALLLSALVLSAFFIGCDLSTEKKVYFKINNIDAFLDIDELKTDESGTYLLVKKGTTVSLPTPESLCDEDEFLGWYLNIGTPQEEKAETEFKVDSDVTLSAKWNKKFYKIFFDFNGNDNGAFNNADLAKLKTDADTGRFYLEVTPNGSVTVPNAFSRNDDYKFEGWKIEGTQTKLQSTFTYTYASDLLVKADWKYDPSGTVNY